MSINKQYVNRIVKKLNSAKDLKKEFKELGFKKIGKTPFKHMSSDMIFKNNMYYIKKNYTCGRIPKNAVPTMNVRIKGDIYRVQPICEPISHTQYDFLSSIKEFNITNYGRDTHKGNLGIYKNKLVVFDW